MLIAFLAFVGSGGSAPPNAMSVRPLGVAASAFVGSPAPTGSASAVPNGITSPTSVGSAVVLSASSFAASSITSAASVGTPAIFEGSPFTATGITSASSVGTPAAEIAISYVASTSESGAVNSSAAASVGDLAVVWAHRTTSETLPTLPAKYGSNVFNVTGGGYSYRVAWVLVEAGDLSGGLFQTGTFTNAGRVTVSVFANASGLGQFDGSVPATTTARAHSDLTGTLAAGAWVVGGSRVVSGTAPLPAGMTARVDLTTHLSYDTAGPVSTWDPANSAAGSNVIYFDWCAEVLPAGEVLTLDFSDPDNSQYVPLILEDI